MMTSMNPGFETEPNRAETLEEITGRVADANRIGEIFKLPPHEQISAIRDQAHALQDALVALYPRLPQTVLDRARAKSAAREQAWHHHAESESSGEPFEPLTNLEELIEVNDHPDLYRQTALDGSLVMPRGASLGWHGAYVYPYNFDFDETLEDDRTYQGAIEYLHPKHTRIPLSPEVEERLEAAELRYYWDLPAVSLIEVIEAVVGEGQIKALWYGQQTPNSDDERTLTDLYRRAKALAEPSVAAPYFDRLNLPNQEAAYRRDLTKLAAMCDQLTDRLGRIVNYQASKGLSAIAQLRAKPGLKLFRHDPISIFVDVQLARIEQESLESEQPSVEQRIEQHHQVQQLWQSVAQALQDAMDILDPTLDRSKTQSSKQFAPYRAYLKHAKGFDSAESVYREYRQWNADVDEKHREHPPTDQPVTTHGEA